MHIGIRGPLYSRNDIPADEALGFCIVSCEEFTTKARALGGRAPAARVP